jgi:hypothetical protein
MPMPTLYSTFSRAKKSSIHRGETRQDAEGLGRIGKERKKKQEVLCARHSITDRNRMERDENLY